MAGNDRLVSVIVPTRNRSELLGEAVSSVLAQEGVDLELIVVDDASSDATPSVLAGFGDRIRVFRSERNIERGAARNLGAREARGCLLAFLDSDDVWRPDKLARQLSLAGTGGPSITGITMIDAHDTALGDSYVPPPDAHKLILKYNPYVGAPSSLVIPAELFTRVGGFPQNWSLQGSEDWVFLITLIRAGHHVAVVPDPLVLYRVHAGMSTADPDRVAVSMWSAVEHLEHDGDVQGAELRSLRCHRAEAIARGFAVRGRFREAGAWALRALRIGGPADAARVGGRVCASVVAGVLRGTGLRRAI
jgi:GT2 family glycosyltransferase